MKNYYLELDGLRGLAALMVFFSHAIGFIAPSDLINYLQQSPLRTFWDGAAAVDFFFVLSGFVLTLPFVKEQAELNYLRYCVRRVFRLYPGYLLVLVFALFLHLFYKPLSMLALSDWSKSLWLDPITISVTLRSATLLLNTNTHAINPVVWSLVTEMRMSLVLPFFILMINRFSHVRSQILLLCCVFALAILIDAMMFLPHFVIGAFLAKNHRYFSSTYLNMSPSKVLLFVAVIFCLYGNRWIVNIGFASIIQSYLTAVASVGLIVTVTNSKKIASVLQTPIFIFLGKTSYSFYLLHLPILLLSVSLIFPVINSIVIVSIISLAIAYGLAIACYHFVEAPSIKFGKFVAKKIA